MLGNVQAVLTGVQRDSGPFSPASLASIHHWFDGSDGSTLWDSDLRTTPAIATGPVGAWDDKISSVSWVQGNIARRPSWNAGETGLTWTTDHLYAAISNLAWTTTGNFQYYVIRQTPTPAGAYALFGGHYNYPGNTIIISATSAVGQIGNGVGFQQSLSGPAGEVTTAVQLSMMRWDNTAKQQFISVDNGAETAGAVFNYTLGYHVNDQVACIGALAPNATGALAAAHSGDISEIVAVEDTTTAEHDSLMAYFNTKYGLSL